MFGKDLIVMDVETTGTDILEGHEAIQFAAVRLDKDTLEEKASFTTLVRALTPERASGVAMGIHKIPMEQILQAPLPGDVIRMAEEALLTPQERESAGRVDILVAGHNTQFDFAFFKQMLSRAGYSTDRWGYQVLDLFSFVQFALATGQWRANLPKVTLDSICKEFGLARVGQAHDALEDVRLTAEAIGKIVAICSRMPPERRFSRRR